MMVFFRSLTVSLAVLLSAVHGFAGLKTASFLHVVSSNFKPFPSQRVDVVNIQLERESYPIYISKDLFNDESLLNKHISAKKVLIVTNTIVGPLYQKRIQTQLEKCGIEVHVIVLPDGEHHKTMDGINSIIDAAFVAKLDRQSCFIALGGGVVGDMCGFAASIYQRGVKFIQIPTTLMAMVDSAVGGKTGVNHPSGKNLIGTFHQPCAVLVDLSTLHTLPDRELRSGLAEAIKYGLIHDASFFTWFENNTNIQHILHRDTTALQCIIKRCCEIKASIVNSDEKETFNVRIALNLGHTFAHAIETGLGYGVLLHGEAVSVGMLMAAELSQELGLIDSTIVKRLRAVLIAAHLPVNFTAHTIHSLHTLPSIHTPIVSNTDCAHSSLTTVPVRTVRTIPHTPLSPIPHKLTTTQFLEYMSHDKKVHQGALTLVLLQNIGSAIVTKQFDIQTMQNVVHRYCNDK